MSDELILQLQQEISDLRAENRKLHDELEGFHQFVRILQFVSEASKEVKTDEAKSHLTWWLTNILDYTLDLFAAPEGSVLWLDPESNELEFVVVKGNQTHLVGKRLQVGEGIAGWVVANNMSCMVEDVTTDTRFSARLDETSTFQTHSIIAAPLTGRGKVLGVVEVINQKENEPFTELHQAMLAVFCDFAGEALANLKS